MNKKAAPPLNFLMGVKNRSNYLFMTLLGFQRETVLAVMTYRVDKHNRRNGLFILWMHNFLEKNDDWEWLPQ